MAKETIERDVEVPLPPGDVWTRLTDVATVASWLPVLHDVTERAPMERYDAVLLDKVGPFKLKADLAVTVTRVEEPTALAVRAAGEDRQVKSRIAVDASIELSPHATGTNVHLVGTYEVTGRVATLGSSTIRTKAQKLVEEFCSRMRQELT